MALITLRPNGVVASSGYANVGGAASLNAALADESDATYADASAATGQLAVTYADLALPALAQIRTVTQRFRASQTSGNLEAGLRLEHDGYAEPWDTGFLSSSINTWSGATHAYNGRGGSWQDADVDALVGRMGIVGPNFVSAGNYRLYALYLDVVTNEAPVVVVTAPAEGGTVTATSRPTVSWTYSDPEGDAQERYRVKVFTAEQYGAAGFDPETAVATWDTLGVISSASSVAVGIDLLSGTTYRAYVRVADVGSGGRYSAWDSNQFTVTLDAPAVPIVSSVASTVAGRTDITVLSRNNMLSLYQASTETPDTSGWINNGNTTITRVTAASLSMTALNGTYVLSLVAVAAGQLNAITSPAGISSLQPASPGVTYTAFAHFRRNAPERQVKVSIAFWNAAGVYIAETQGALLTEPAAGWSAPATVTVVAPATTTHMAMTVQVLGVALGEQHVVDSMGIVPGTINILTEQQASFETGAIAPGWAAYGFPDSGGASWSVVDDPTAPQGGKVCKITVGANNGWRGINTPALVTAVQNHAFVVWMRASVAGKTAQLYVSGAPDPVANFTLTTSWAPYSLTFGHVAAGIFVRTNNPDFDLYVDAVSVQPGALTTYHHPPAWTRGGSRFTSNGVVALERSDDGGLTWQPLNRLVKGYGFGGYAATNDVGTDGSQGLGSVSDYEAPRGREVRYRAKGVEEVSGQTLASATSAVAPFTSPEAATAWLKSPSDPTKNIVVIHEELAFPSVSTEEQGVFYAAGRPEPIVMAGTVRAEVFPALHLFFANDAEWEAFETLRKRAEPVLFQTCYGDGSPEQWWLRLGPDREVVRLTYPGMGTAQYRRVTVGARQVKAPV